jgi:hypothetical protein
MLFPFFLVILHNKIYDSGKNRMGELIWNFWKFPSLSSYIIIFQLQLLYDGHQNYQDVAYDGKIIPPYFTHKKNKPIIIME